MLLIHLYTKPQINYLSVNKSCNIIYRVMISYIFSMLLNGNVRGFSRVNLIMGYYSPKLLKLELLCFLSSVCMCLLLSKVVLTGLIQTLRVSILMVVHLRKLPIYQTNKIIASKYKGCWTRTRGSKMLKVLWWGK